MYPTRIVWILIIDISIIKTNLQNFNQNAAYSLYYTHIKSMKDGMVTAKSPFMNATFRPQDKTTFWQIIINRYLQHHCFTHSHMDEWQYSVLFLTNCKCFLRNWTFTVGMMMWTDLFKNYCFCTIILKTLFYGLN